MTVIKRQFLIVTDDSDISQTIQRHFKSDQTTAIHCASSLSQALNYVLKDSYCVLVVDLQLPGIDETEMIRIFRIAKYVPILALTEPLDSDAKIMLFHAGVDVFLEKPINVDVCLAQVNALAELYLKSDNELSKHTPITFSTAMMIAPRYRQVLIEGKPLNLTRKEFDLLHFFAKHPGQVFSRKQLYDQVWGGFYELGGDESVKSHIKTLRKKLSVLGPNLIENVRGVGYRFIPPE